MLAEAARLANEMRSLSSHTSGPVTDDGTEGVNDKKQQEETNNNEAAADVEAVVRASQDMAKALAALSEEHPDDEEEEEPPASAPTSPEPRSPDSFGGESKDTLQTTHVVETKVPLAKVVPVGDDIVAVRDYSKKQTTGVKWEKVSYTSQEEDDYMPMVDYSRQASPTKSRAAATTSRRSNRKKRVRRAALLGIVIVIALFVAYKLGFLANPFASQPAVEAPEVVAQRNALQQQQEREAAATEALRNEARQRARDAEKAAAEARARRDAEKQAQLQAQRVHELKQAEQQAQLSRDIEMICHFGIFSPLCERAPARPPRPARGRQVQELLQAMMQ